MELAPSIVHQRTGHRDEGGEGFFSYLFTLICRAVICHARSAAFQRTRAVHVAYPDQQTSEPIIGQMSKDTHTSQSVVGCCSRMPAGGPLIHGASCFAWAVGRTEPQSALCWNTFRIREGQSHTLWIRPMMPSALSQ